MSSSSGTPEKLRERAISWAWLLAMGTAVWFLSFHPMRNTDLWWHLAAGRWILTHHAVPRADPFAFTTQGSLWLNHEWLADVIYAAWASLGGTQSLVYWYWGILLATFLGLYASCRRLGAPPWSSYLGACLAAATAAAFFEIRPHLYSLLLYVGLLGWVLPGPRLPRALPVLFLLWANLHAGFVIGFLVLAAVLVPALLEDLKRWRASGSLQPVWAERRGDLLTVGLCFLACCINPFGIRLLSYPLRYALDRDSPFHDLKEWLPPFSPGGVSSPLFLWMIGLFLLCLVLLPLRRRSEDERRALWPAAGLAVLTLLMALRSGRFIPLFAISAAFLSAQVLRIPPRELRPPSKRAKRDRRTAEGRPFPRIALPLVLAAGALALLVRDPLGEQAFSHLATLDSFPVDTMDFVEQNGLSGRVLSYYGWGGYVQYRTQGRMKVYIDSRADSVYGDRTFDDYRRVQYMLPGWIDVVEASGAHYFLWLSLPTPQVPRIDQPRFLLATGRWRKLHEDFVSVLLVRREVPLPAVLRVPGSSYHELALGSSAMQAGDLAAAETHLRTALHLDRNSSRACVNLSLVLARQGHIPEAEAMRKRCYEIFPDGEEDTYIESFIARQAAQSGAG